MFPIRDHNPSGRVPYVTYALIAINIFVFLLYAQLLFDPDQRRLAAFFDVWALVPAEFTSGIDRQTLLYSMFLHGSIMHIGGNMLFLWIFGDNLEDRLGHVGFLLFYLGTGAVASLAHVWADPMSQVPTVGASGAISGVMGGYLLLFPLAKVDIAVILGFIFRIFTWPAWAMLGVWFGMQLLGGFTTPTEGGGVAYWAHAGGFVAGLAAIGALWLLNGAPGGVPWAQGGHPHEDEFPRRSSVPSVRRSASKGPWGRPQGQKSRWDFL
ncbi:MAG: rhomboid family intramembrane serine protease [Neomegalonema sp.]|nr:rhomboid family intramembrane serine protease [Neomegalonema sp.]